MLECEAQFKEEAAYERLYLSIKAVDRMRVFRFGAASGFSSASKDWFDTLFLIKQRPFLFGLKVKTARTVPFQANNQVISVRMGRRQFDSFDLSIDQIEPPWNRQKVADNPLCAPSRKARIG